MKKYRKNDFREEIQEILREINLPDDTIVEKMWKLEHFKTNRVTIIGYRLHDKNVRSEKMMQHWRSLRDKLKRETQGEITGTLESRVEQLRISDFLCNLLTTVGKLEETQRRIVEILEKSNSRR